MKVQAALAGLAAVAAAFPAMGQFNSEFRDQIKRNAEAVPDEYDDLERRGLLSNLGEDVNGLLGSVTKGTLDLNNKRPEPGYEFRAPGPGDSRGPCPGLNLLANYGYLPRNGYVSGAQIMEATARGFNMGQDLSAVLIIFAVLADGNIQEESWWLGTDPKSGVGGLNRHSTVEADISPNREDFYNGCGDNHHLSSRMFARNTRYAAQSLSKQFSIPVMARHFASQVNFVKKYNPTLYYFPFPMIVSVVAYNFYPRFFSNGTSELGGVANYESISSIVGAQYDKKSGNFKYVPERWPENWYRRAFPYTAEQALLEGYTMVYPANPALVPGAIQLPPQNTFNFTNLMCDTYQGLNSITPLALAGQEAAAARKISWAIGMFDSHFKNTLLGCHKNTVSKNFYPNKHQKGGPLNPGPAYQKGAGNNVYGKVYWPEAPRQPQC